MLKRACPQTGVTLRRSNPRQREREHERNNKNREKRSVGRMAKHINPPVVEALDEQRPSIIQTLKSQPAGGATAAESRFNLLV